MSTLTKWQQLRLRRLGLMKYLPSTKQTLRGWRAALIGLLLICVTATSACKSASSLPPEPQQVTVDASLMVQSNYTKQLLDVLSK